MITRDQVAVGLANALLAGPCNPEAFAQRLESALGQKYRWIVPFAKRVFQHFGTRLAYAQRRELVQHIQKDTGYRKARDSFRLRIRHYYLISPVMLPRIGALAECILPELPTPGDLAAWLGLTVGELSWYADPRGIIGSIDGPLCHYHYKWVSKRHGDYRLIESPKDRLCAIQRKILREILDRVPVHSAAHGFRRGHSCMSYAAQHVAKQTVLRMDLKNFFGSIAACRVNALYQTLGYPEGTARYLTGLCTNRVPTGMFEKISGAGQEFVVPRQERLNLSTPHLPQGAPTSPALANLCSFRLDLRFDAFAKNVGADYTRYADDLAFSGDDAFRRKVERFYIQAAAIALEEGFDVNFRKTRIMHQSNRQMLTGIVVNDKMNMHRAEYDRLKATLQNCLRFDPHTQNREGHHDYRAHLAGRINHLKNLNQSRGAKLQALFELVEW